MSGEWQTTGLNEAGINAQAIAAAIQRIQAGEYRNIHTILIVKGGKLAFEAYFDGCAWNYQAHQFRGKFTHFSSETLQNLASVTKSFTSILTGIAIDRGFIPDVEAKVMAFFPEYASLNDARKDQVTLHHLLTMTSGLEWNEMALPYEDGNNDLIRLYNAPDPIGYILAKPVMHTPGERWDYNSACANLLGEIIRKTSGLRLDDFANAYLFGPLGIRRCAWETLNGGVVFASGNLRLNARDTARLGLLCLNGGLWNGERIVSQEWIAASTRSYSTPEGAGGYGYHWWLERFQIDATAIDSYYAAGWGGQRLMVFPNLEMVVVLTGGNYVGDEPVDEILSRYILPAVVV